MSCQTRPAVKPVDIDLQFPVFPDPTDNAVMMDVGTQFLPAGENQIYESTIHLVVMPLDYWLLITEYKIEVDRVEEIYKAVK